MYLIAGLGNPGDKYDKTRHNTGFMVLDELARELRSEKWDMSKKYNSYLVVENSDLILAKPQTFMNESGKALSAISNFFKIPADDIYVIHDDLDIRFGEYKIQKGVGPKVHYGVQSIEESLGTKEFWRVRIGVDNRDPENRTPGETYVLQGFSLDELLKLKAVTDSVIKELLNDLKVEKE